jgi:hypothetical protein
MFADDISAQIEIQLRDVFKEISKLLVWRRLTLNGIKASLGQPEGARDFHKRDT